MFVVVGCVLNFDRGDVDGCCDYSNGDSIPDDGSDEKQTRLPGG